jgi:hypothetical protein
MQAIGRPRVNDPAAATWRNDCSLGGIEEKGPTVHRRMTIAPAVPFRRDHQRIEDPLIRARQRRHAVLHGGSDSHPGHAPYLTVSLALARTIRGGGTRW